MPSTYRHIGEAAPYYDDYVGSKHDDKGYVKVLWKPSRAVQARELTQMQTYAQNQVASLGGYLFKDGTIVQGGIISTTTKQKYFIATLSYPTGLALDDVMAGFMSNNKVRKTSNENATDNKGLYPIGIDNIKFQIVGWTTLYDNDGNPVTTAALNDRGLTTVKVIVFYNLFGGSFGKKNSDGTISYDSDGVGITFSNPVRDIDATLTVQNLLNPNPTSLSNVYLTCTCASCTKGTIFVDGYFVNCPMASVLVNPIGLNADNTIYVEDLTSAKNQDVEFNIGFWIERRIVDASEDETLTDPASGTYNSKAPGADRYSILAKLRCFSSAEIEQMIEDGENILQVNAVSDIENGGGATSGIKFAGGIVMKNNIVIKEQTNVGTNSALMDELARRTYEESGNYTVNPWKIQVEAATKVKDDGTKADVPSKYTVSVSPGLGYVYGYRVSTCVSQMLENTKSRTTLLREGNSKFTEDSLNVLSDDIYTLNDSSDAPTRNVNSWHLEKVMSSAKAYLLDRKIGEMLKTYSSDASGSWTVARPNETEASTITLNSEEIAVLGTASLVDVSADGWYNLKLSLLNIEGATNLSNTSSIASFDENGVLTGYIDLLHNGEGNTTIWKNVEAPMIFELDWPYVAPSSDTFATYICNVFVEGTESVKTDNYVTITYSPPASIGSPANSRAVNFLVDATTGEVIPGSKVEVKDNSTDSNFTIREIAPGILKQNVKYWISYQGDGKVVAAKSASENSTSSTKFRTKTLEIGSMTINGSELSDLVTKINDGGDDIFELKLGDSSSNSLSGETSREFVTDLVKILAIERVIGTSEDNNQTTTDVSEELYWKIPNGLSGVLEVTDGCTDFRYEAPTIKGLGRWCIKEYENGSTSISDSIKITFAYWKHEASRNESGGSFYYAGSYTLGSSVVFNETDSGDSFKKRLAEWYNVKSIGEDPDDAYKLIPTYKASSGAWYDLANCIDFRPDWNGTTYEMKALPMPASRVQYTIETYLPRIDTVWVDKNGTFGISQGTPSDNPIAPKEKDGTLILYNIYNKPYGKTLDDVVIEYIDNRRHTMIDITSIENRLSNLEEVVSLSMAEQSAVNMQIVDEDGANRYKCGVFTDSFSSFDNCGFSDDEWKATIDTVEKCIRADFELKDWGFSPVGTYIKNGETFELETIELIGESDPNNVLTTVFGQKQSTFQDGSLMTGGTILTIAPLKNQHWKDQGCPSQYSWVYAKNDAVSEATNLQSQMFVVWNGNLTLTPAIDTWTNDLGEIVTETWQDSERPPDSYRSWTTTTDGSTSTSSRVVQTIPSGLTWKDLDKLYGKNWHDVPKSQRVTHLPGWWEPATTLTEVTTYKTVTATTVTQKTTYTGSWQANDVSTYMESQDEYMRTRKVKYELKGMRPNQTFNAAMDKVPLKLLTVEQFNNPDTLETSYSDTMTTDSDGNAVGYFVVPENMPVGTKTVEFYDDEETSAAIADYTANGKTVWTNVDRTYIRKWTAETSESVTGKSTTKVEVGKTMTSTATAIFHNEDPIAESFYVEEQDGITLESIQIFFASKDPSVGVEVFIVECENGYPGQTVVPFSRVFVPSSEVELITKDEIANGTLTPTTFKFPVPIQLQGLTEYAFIVIAPSYNYEIYTSTLGKADIRTGMGIREQPYVGSMFKSQNLKTWTPEPLSDVTFRLYQYQFPTGIECKADFALDDLVSRNTGMGTTLPESDQSGEGSTEFAANSMTVSIGSYVPTATSITYEWYSDAASATTSKEHTPFENKQDIFFKEREGLAICNTMETKSSNDAFRFTNRNSSIKVRAFLKTDNPNIAPQIDLEDFHGIFTRNLVDIDRNNPFMIIDGKEYFDAGTYISSTIALKDPALGIKVAIDAMLPNESLIKGYFKTTGSLKSYNSVWVPSLAEADYVLHEAVETTEGLSEMQEIQQRLLPGYEESSWKEITDERAYIWYYIYDIGDSRKKFIVPNQEAHYNKDLAGYSQSSCIFKSVSTTGETTLLDMNNIDTKATKLVLKDPVNIDIVPDPISYLVVSDASATGGSRKLSVKYEESNSNCIILGVMAIPMNGPFDPSNIPARGQNAYYDGLMCSEYDDEHIYVENEVCLYNGDIWMCNEERLLGLSPSNDALSWTRIPCALMVSGMVVESASSSQWMELNVNDYTPSTERETNFMEYNYTLPSSLELNEFDSFMLKLQMLALNSKDIPRFRNLRAVAVY